jgi:hypothetical protein
MDKLVKRQPGINHHVTRKRPSVFTGKEHQDHHALSPPCEFIIYFICNLINGMLS